LRRLPAQVAARLGTAASRPTGAGRDGNGAHPTLPFRWRSG